MKLTNENYFSVEAMHEYMSTSQFKAFEQCESKALAELNGEYVTEKEAYKEGHYFEAALEGGQAEELFLMQNPDMVSSRGASKGELKANYKRVQGSVEAFKNQPMFMDIISKCQSQVIVEGIIAGIKFKGCVDFYNPETGESYDTKCMKDFKKIYSESDGRYVQWYFGYGYHYQAAIYQELIRQTFGKIGKPHILAVTKEEIPDVMAIEFSDEIVQNALEIVEEFAPKYDAIKKGLETTEACGKCDYCKQNKVVSEFETIIEFE